MANSDLGRARMAAALGNHRRIEIIRLLRLKPDLPLEDIAHFCKVETSTACEHVRRLHEAGLVKKKSKGRRVLHSAPHQLHTCTPSALPLLLDDRPLTSWIPEKGESHPGACHRACARKHSGSITSMRGTDKH